MSKPKQYSKIKFDLDEVLHTDPHYTNSEFRESRVIFGNYDKATNFEYADRLYQWDSEKHTEAWKKTEESGVPKNTGRFFQEYLRNYHDDHSIILECVVAGVRMDNGYSWLCYGYSSSTSKTPE